MDERPAIIFHRKVLERYRELKKKAENIAGPRVADLLAYPIKQDILVKGGVSGVTCGTFGESICLAVWVGDRYRREEATVSPRVGLSTHARP